MSDAAWCLLKPRLCDPGRACLWKLLGFQQVCSLVQAMLSSCTACSDTYTQEGYLRVDFRVTLLGGAT